jgi:hypothetical protein
MNSKTMKQSQQSKHLKYDNNQTQVTTPATRSQEHSKEHRTDRSKNIEKPRKNPNALITIGKPQLPKT